MTSSEYCICAGDCWSCLGATTLRNWEDVSGIGRIRHRIRHLRLEMGSRLQGFRTREESDRDAKVWHVEAKRLGDSRVSKRLDGFNAFNVRWLLDHLVWQCVVIR